MTDITKERGHAEIRILLRDGEITVFHHEGDVVLYCAPVREGAWDALWEVLDAYKLDRS